MLQKRRKNAGKKAAEGFGGGPRRLRTVFVFEEVGATHIDEELQVVSGWDLEKIYCAARTGER